MERTLIILKPDAVPLYKALLAKLDALAGFGHEAIEAAFKEFCAEQGIKMGQIGPPVRVALCGGTTSPSIYEVLEVLGRDEARRRVERAIAFIGAK